MWFRIAMLTSKGTPSNRTLPWISSTGALMPDRSGKRTRVYAGMRTFI